MLKIMGEILGGLHREKVSGTFFSPFRCGHNAPNSEPTTQMDIRSVRDNHKASSKRKTKLLAWFEWCSLTHGGN